MKKVICLSFGIASFFMSNHYCAAMDHPEQMSRDELCAFRLHFQGMMDDIQQAQQAGQEVDPEAAFLIQEQLQEINDAILRRQEEEEEDVSEEESSADNLSNLETDGQEEEEVAADLPNDPVTSDQEEVSTTDNLTHSETNIQETAEPAADLPNNPVTNAQEEGNDHQSQGALFITQAQDDDFERELQEAMRVIQMQNGSNAN